MANASALGKLFTPASNQLRAKELLLPELRTTSDDANITWDKWYGRIAKVIYAGWQNTDVGPGIATVRVTVTKSERSVESD